jgi:predicted permease
LFFAIFGNLIRWSYGYQLLRKHEGDDVSSDIGSTIHERHDEEVVAVSKYKTFNNHASTSTSTTASHSNSADNSDDEGNEHYLSTKRGMPSRQLSAVTISVVDEHSTLLPETNKDAHHNKQTPTAKDSIFTTVANKINGFMSPPLYAALLALFVGLTPLKGLMYDKQSFLYPSVTKAIEGCGKAAVPLILTCLGAQLVSIQESQQPTSPAMNKPVATAIAIRMCLMPFLVVPIVCLFVLYGSRFSSLAQDPVFITMMIVLGCTPTAINLVQITQVNNIFEEEMLRMLFWSYGVVCVPICTFTVFLALNVVDRML